LKDASQSKQIKALWVAVALLATGFSTTLFLLGRDLGRDLGIAPPVTVPVDPSCPEILRGPLDGLALPEKVRRSDAIVIARLEPSGGQLKAIATDVIVRNQGVEVLYKVGEEVPLLNPPAGTGTNWGDGVVAFLIGSPASIEESYYTRSGRIPSMGDMSIEEFRRSAIAP